ncbi:unnamed protein product [Peniophora sp. CBMAI 1063]|nr:unnamed protein product [Peniophora sp. CBMAI 1063]
MYTARGVPTVILHARVGVLRLSNSASSISGIKGVEGTQRSCSSLTELVFGVKMTDWKGPTEVTRDTLYLAKVLHACFGCAIWEFASHLDYEWDILRGKRPFRWTICLYSGCRLSMLLAFTFLILITNGLVTSNCRGPYTAAMFFSYSTVSLASLLIILRISAIWQRQVLIMVVSCVAWLGGVVLNIRDLTLLQATYNESFQSCISFDASKFAPNTIGILGTDTLLLGLALTGLLRMKEERQYGVARFLYHQGIIWLGVAVLVEVPVVTLSLLNLNDPLILMFQPVELASLGLCATRMFRALTNYSVEPLTSIALEIRRPKPMPSIPETRPDGWPPSSLV